MPRKTQEQMASYSDVAVMERRAAALTLRRQGSSYAQISRQMQQIPAIQERWPDYSERTAHDDVMSEMQRLADQNIETTLEIRSLELQRLDELMSRYWNKATAGDHASLDRVLAIMDRRAKYLGLNQPQAFDVNIRWDQLDVRQLQRLAEGEDPRRVIIDAEPVAALAAPEDSDASDNE